MSISGSSSLQIPSRGHVNAFSCEPAIFIFWRPKPKAARSLLSMVCRACRSFTKASILSDCSITLNFRPARVCLRVVQTGRIFCGQSGRNEHSMAIKITDECINCGACEPECPNTAIYEGQKWTWAGGTKLTEVASDGGSKSGRKISPGTRFG